MRQGKRKLLRRIIWIMVPLVILIAFLIYFSIVAIDRPPVVSDRSSLEQERVQPGKEIFIFGNNWLRKSESGLWEMYIEGDPFERGVAFGALTKELLYYQETVFVEQIRELVPSDTYLKLLKYFTAFFNRNLDKNIPEEYKLEIYGTSLFCSHEYDFIGSGYQRQLNYHAAHDIGHALQGLNMVGCTSFASWKSKSADSCLLVGRNFDFYAGDKFAENKIVCFVNPDSGYKYMMVTWADMTGVVSGMNEKGITVTLNAAKSTVPAQAATPVSILAKEILQYASTIQEAYAISKKRKLFVSESLLIGSKTDGKAVIIEKSPHKTGFFDPGQEEIVCSNHFQSSAFAGDRINLENIRESDSKYRFDRMNELLSKYDKIDVTSAVSVLRNQKGIQEAELGMGNQLAINQLIAHHSVVFKPDSLLVWVSTSPFQLGKFVAYDLHKIFEMKVADVKPGEEIYLTNRTIPADSFLFSDGYKNFQKYRIMTLSLKEYRKNEQVLPDSFAAEYISSNPLFYLTFENLADYFYKIKNDSAALAYYRESLSKPIPGTAKKEEIEKKIGKLNKKMK